MTVSAVHLARRIVMAVTLVAGCTGCSTPTSPDQLSGLTLQVALSGSNAAPPGATFPPTIVAEGRSIVVLGIITTPCVNYTISAAASKSGNQVTIRLTARQIGEGCLTAIGEFAYRVAAPIARGTYSVEVVYEYPGTGRPTEVVRTAAVLVY